MRFNEKTLIIWGKDRDIVIKFEPKPEHDLYSDSLKPVDFDKKNVKPFGMGVIWFGLGVQITVFLTLSPLLQYYTITQFMIASIFGQAALIMIGCLIWDIGLKYGVSFATSITSSFGPTGGKIIGIIRILPGLFFFGVNGYLGGTALNEISKTLFNFDNIWVYIIVNSALLVYVVIKGSKGIEIFAKIAMPVLIFSSVYLAMVVFNTYDATWETVMNMGATLEPRSLFYGICVTIGGYTAVVIGMNDFGKDLKVTEEEVNKGWWCRNRKFLGWSMVLGVIGYTFISTLALICVALTGETNPLSMITQMIGARSIWLSVLIQAFIFFAQLSTNSGANLYPAVYVLCSIAPKRVNVTTAAIGFAALSIIMRPWTFTGMDTIYMVIGSFAGPIFGIIIVDYYIFRKMTLSLDDLYKSRGKYYYWRGFNIPGLITCAIATVIAVLVPDYSFLISAGLGAILYYFLAKAFGGKMPYLIKENVDNAPKADGSNELA